MDRVNAELRRVPPWTVYLLGLGLLLWLFWQILSGDLGPDPVKAVERQLGLLGLQFLVASLCVTPLRWVGLNLLRYRRALGLVAFGFVALHLLAWVVLDLGLRWSEIWADIVKRPYIIVGMIGFLTMLPLALTSNTASIRRLGALVWGRLHQLAYVAGLAGAIHFVMVGKVWNAESLLYAAAVLVLLVLRAAKRLLRRRTAALG
jgi:methionine sulfoxide reductase heme-binding subunit